MASDGTLDPVIGRAVEVSFLGNQKDTRIYQLEVVWYHGDLGTLVFRLKLGLIVSADTIGVQVGLLYLS